MSIYCSSFGIGEEHLPRCKRMKKITKGALKGSFEQDDSKPCTCGSCPIRFQGSNVLPSNKDARGGSLDIAEIPSHITRDGRDDKPEGEKPYPWIRVGISEKDLACGDTVILTRKQAENLRDYLTGWLERT